MILLVDRSTEAILPTSLFVALLIAGMLSGCEQDIYSEYVAKTGVSEYSKDDKKPRVNLPYFNNDGELEWNDALVADYKTEPCASKVSAETKKHSPWRTMVLLSHPRVEQKTCGYEEKILVGIGENGRVIWRRDLRQQRGESLSFLYVQGVSPSSLVLSNLEVLSPKTGKVIREPPATIRMRYEENVYNVDALFDPVAFRSSNEDYLVYVNFGKPLPGADGLYKFDVTSEEFHLVYGGENIFQRKVLVTSMAVDESGHYLLMAGTKHSRGRSKPVFQVFDLITNTLIHREYFDDLDIQSDLDVLAGPGGKAVFVVRNYFRSFNLVVEYTIRR